MPEAFNLADWLFERALGPGGGGGARVAVRSDGRDLTYAEVAAASAAAGGALRRLGVRPEERVLLALPDGPALVAAVLGALRIGAVVVPAPSAPGLADHGFLVEHSRATVAVVDPAVRADVAGGAGGRRHLRAVLDPDEWAAACAAEPGELESEPTGRDDAAFWLYSSGTTGRPKAAVHLHQDAAHCAEGFAGGVLGMGADDRTFSVSRMTTPSGLCNSIVFPFSVGASTVLVADPGGDAVARVLRDDRPTLLFARPANYRALLEADGAGGGGDGRAAAPALRLAVSSGDTLPAGLHERFRERFGIDVVEGTGSTEALHIYLCNRPGRVRPGSSGEVVPGYEARLVDDDGTPVGDGEVGVLQVRGGSICERYARDRDRTRDAFVGRWLVTGDRYRRDGDGVFWYVGRADDTWFQDGRWMAPVEIEEALASHPAVREAGVVGVDVGGGRRAALACVVLAGGGGAGGGDHAEALAAELRAHVAARLDDARAPAEVRFVASLPRTATGKVQRFRLREASG